MKRPGRKAIFIISIVALVAVAVSLLFWLRKKPADILDVPLGVEEAVIVTYNGNPIEPIPFKWGVAVNVRLAGVVEKDGNRVHDIRYIVNRAGDYDIKDYFRGTNGKPVEGFPSFKVRGSNELSKDIEQRIAETETVKIAISARYYETMTALAMFWVLWLLALIFVGRRKPAMLHAEPPHSTLADDIRRLLKLLASGSLDTEQRAKLEMMIFKHWRDQQSLGDVPMDELLARFRADPEVSAAYTELENWLHRSAQTASAASVVDVVRARIKSPQRMEPASS